MCLRERDPSDVQTRWLKKKTVSGQDEQILHSLICRFASAQNKNVVKHRAIRQIVSSDSKNVCDTMDFNLVCAKKQKKAPNSQTFVEGVPIARCLSCQNLKPGSCHARGGSDVTVMSS